VPFHFFLEIQDMHGEAVVWAIKRHQLAEAARRQKGLKKKAKTKMCVPQVRVRVCE